MECNHILLICREIKRGKLGTPSIIKLNGGVFSKQLAGEINWIDRMDFLVQLHCLLAPTKWNGDGMLKVC